VEWLKVQALSSNPNTKQTRSTNGQSVYEKRFDLALLVIQNVTTDTVLNAVFKG
jgi:hypothetical protein